MMLVSWAGGGANLRVDRIDRNCLHLNEQISAGRDGTGQIEIDKGVEAIDRARLGISNGAHGRGSFFELLSPFRFGIETSYTHKNRL